MCEEESNDSASDVFVTPPSSPQRRQRLEEQAALVAQLRVQLGECVSRRDELEGLVSDWKAKCSQLEEQLIRARAELRDSQQAVVKAMDANHMHGADVDFEKQLQLWEQKESAMRATIDFLFAQLQAADNK